jgi:hypothetical protein
MLEHLSFLSYILYKLEGITLILFFFSFMFRLYLVILVSEFLLVILETSPSFLLHAESALLVVVQQL